MAATKKPTTKKPAAKKPAAKKTTSARKTPAKTATSRTVHTVKKATPAAKAESRSLRLQKESEKFMSVRFNRETLYWVILGAIVILFTLWIMQLQSDISDLYDQIEVANAMSDEADTRLMIKSQEK